MGFNNLPSGLVAFMQNAPSVGGRPQENVPIVRPRRAEQLDESNLAGPVPTELNGDNRFDPMTILNRGVNDSGQPDMGTSPSRVDSIESPTQGKFTLDAMGVPRETPPSATRPLGLNNPAIPQTPYDRLNNGTPMPTLQDSKYQDMGRGASAKAAFLQGMKSGGLIGGGINALIGVLDKGYGRQAQYNQDASRWFNTKDAQLQAESADPVLRSRIAAGQFEQELPGRIAQQKAYQESIGNRQLTTGEQRGEQRLDEIELRNKGALDRVGATYDEKSSAKLNERTKDMIAESKNPGNVNYGLNDDQIRAKAAEGIGLEQKAALAKTQAQTAHYQELTKGVGERIQQAEQRIKIMQQNANTNAGRLAQGQANASQRANNQSVNNQLKSLSGYATSLRAQYSAAAKTLNDPYSSEDAKSNAEKDMHRINGEMNDVDAQSRGLTGAPARGAKGAPPAAGGPHPQQGKAFKNPDDGKWYVADEIDASGNITKYHPRP